MPFATSRAKAPIATAPHMRIRRQGLAASTRALPRNRTTAKASAAINTTTPMAMATARPLKWTISCTAATISAGPKLKTGAKVISTSIMSAMPSSTPSITRLM